MSMQQFADGSERFIRRHEYEDSWVVVADAGLSEDKVDVDIIESMAIVVAGTGDRVTEAEFKLPAGGDADVVARNSVFTVTFTK